MSPSVEVRSIGIRDLKKSLWKSEFRGLFPEYDSDIRKFLSNPGCKCNLPLFNSILSHEDRLKSYFGENITIVDSPVTRAELLSKVMVINTTIDQLESEIRKLPVGPKHISLARFERDITAVIQLLA